MNIRNGRANGAASQSELRAKWYHSCEPPRCQPNQVTSGDSLLSLPYRFIGKLKGRPCVGSGTLGLIVCVCIALVGTEVWQLWGVYEANIRQTEVVTANTARSMAEQAASTLKTADTIVRQLGRAGRG